jgi:acylphosphatase
MERMHLRIEGMVQGVGFRWFAMSQARALGLAGVVRNCPDGAVEIEAEGARDALERFLETMRRGPGGARVDRVQPTWSAGPARHAEFVIARGAR